MSCPSETLHADCKLLIFSQTHKGASPALPSSAFTFMPRSSPQALPPLLSSMKPGPSSALATRHCARLAGEGGVALAFEAWFRERQPPCLCWMNARMWARGKALLHWPQVRRSRPSSGAWACGGGRGGGGWLSDEVVPSDMSVTSEEHDRREREERKFNYLQRLNSFYLL